MFKRGNREFISDIREAVERIEKYTGEMNYEMFYKIQRHRMRLFATSRLSVKQPRTSRTTLRKSTKILSGKTLLE